MQVADYDGDGNRVKTVVGSTTTAFVGNILEWTGSTTTMKKYYYSNGQRVAMRQGSSTLYYLLTDHLGSTAITATSSGGRDAELRYYPWGGTRYTYGTTPTSYRYTGQREVASIGLYFYNARWYDSALGRFVQADSIIPNPGDPPSFDRFAYVRNNPIIYIDPTGHSSSYCDQYPQECIDDASQPACGDELDYEHVSYGKEDCVLVPMGDWHISLYNYALLADVRTDLFNGGVSETVNVRHLGNITVPWRFLFGAEGVAMQGTGILADGTPITVGPHQDDPDLGGWQYSNGYPDYYAGTIEFELGWGGPGHRLTPYLYGAVGPTFRRQLFYVPVLSATSGGGFISGATGGGAIKDYQLDLFVGEGYQAIRNAKQDYGFSNPIGGWPPVQYEVYRVVCHLYE